MNKIGGNRITREMVIQVTVPNPTLANALVEASLQLDKDFDRIIGVGYFEISNGNQANNYLIGFRTNRKQWIDDIPFGAWDARSGVSPMGKYYETDIPYGAGDTCYARVTPLGLTSAAFVGYMVLILERTLTELPK